jgi:predicted Fe-Mo cluster-binding NifX family protein
MKRVAIPIVQGKLSQYFGQCSHYLIFDIDGKKISSTELEVPPLHDLIGIPGWAAQQGITDIIAYKIDSRIISRFINNKINLFVGVRFDTPLALIDDFINGRLKSDEKIIREITETVL